MAHKPSPRQGLVIGETVVWTPGFHQKTSVVRRPLGIRAVGT
jgi:hypothetical protein